MIGIKNPALRIRNDYPLAKTIQHGPVELLPLGKEVGEFRLLSVVVVPGWTLKLRIRCLCFHNWKVSAGRGKNQRVCVLICNALASETLLRCVPRRKSSPFSGKFMIYAIGTLLA